MSVPSAKSTVMSVRAYLAMERSMVWRGMPSISTSMRLVIRDSTSSGVMPGRLDDDLDLGAGDVREGVDGGLLEGAPPAPDEEQHRQQHQQPLGERKLD